MRIPKALPGCLLLLLVTGLSCVASAESSQHGNFRDRYGHWTTSYYGDESPPAFPHVFVDTTKQGS